MILILLITTVTFILWWSLCSFLTYGLNNSYFWHNYPILQHDTNRWQEVKRWSILFCISGPFGIIATFVNGFYKYGLMYRKREDL